MKKKRLLCIGLALVLLLTLAGCGAPSSSAASSSSVVSVSPSEASILPAAASSAAASQMEFSRPSSASEEELPFDAPEMWQEPLPKGLIRGWHGDIVVGAGLAEQYLFLKDGTFYFEQNQNSRRERLRYMDGEWFYKDNTVHLTVKRKVVIEGGELVPVEGFWEPPEYTIEGGTYVRIELPESEYEILELPLEVIPADEDLEARRIPGSIMLGDLQLYAMGGIVYDELLTLWDYYGTL